MLEAFVCIQRDSKGASGTHLPPKSCIPKRAKTTMKRKRRKMREMMDFIEFIRDTTRFLRDAQYLQKNRAAIQLQRIMTAHIYKATAEHVNAFIGL